MLNEAGLLPGFCRHVLSDLQPDEVIIVDGGSQDASVQLAAAHCPQARLLQSPAGRDRQLNAALQVAGGDIIICCPVDVRLQRDSLRRVRQAVAQGIQYGCLYQRSARHTRLFALQDLLARLRARWCASAYIDQVPFWLRTQIQAAGGFRALQSYDTADLCRRLGRPQHFRLVPGLAVSSCRAWQGGFWRQTIANQRRRLRYLRHCLLEELSFRSSS